MTTISLIRIPASPVEFVAAKPSSLTAEMKALLREPEHYTEILPYLRALAGETETINGSARYDEYGCVAVIKEMCGNNGYNLLAKLNLAQVSRVLKTS